MPSVHVLLSVTVGKLSQLVIGDLTQILPILPVASCAVSETLPGTSLSYKSVLKGCLQWCIISLGLSREVLQSELSSSSELCL